MRPAFRLDMSLPHLLQPIVSDRGCGFQPLFKIARLDEIAFPSCVIAPHTGIAIRLQFHADRQGIGLCIRSLVLEPGDLRGDARQILHVMSHLMGDDVRLGEIAGSPEPLGEFEIGRAHV